jgi:hypothetical protein
MCWGQERQQGTAPALLLCSSIKLQRASSALTQHSSGKDDGEMTATAWVLVLEQERRQGIAPALLRCSSINFSAKAARFDSTAD